jgi:glycosyltransferase involved in cell wall biosynthesis
MTAPFSVLLPVWRGDRADWFAASLRSVTRDQTLRPDQVVVVLDGPVGASLRSVLEEAGRDEVAGPLLELVELPENRGLPTALNAGLEACRHELVARQDADDVSLPERFAAQVPLLDQGADLVGSALREFTEEPGEGLRLGPVRPRPTGDDEIRRYLRTHSPFNHPSVVFRRHQVRAVGGYPDLPVQEDYALWARLLAAGARGANHPEALVLYRTGDALYRRRGGARNLRVDLAIQRELRRLGFVGPVRAVVNLALRLVYRTVPPSVRRRLYQRVLTDGPGPGGAAASGTPGGSLP